MAGHRPPTVITHDSGVQFSIQIGKHRLVVDQGPNGGGADAGPTPIQLLGASLGACIALYVKHFCAARSLPFDGMRVEVEQHGAQHPNRVDRFDVRVVLPAPLPDPYRELIDQVIRSCPAWNTLDRGAEIVVEIAEASLAAS